MIKKIYTLLLMACCIGFVGCSDDDETVQATLKVVKSDVSYDCFGGEGTIEVNSVDPVTATSSVNWCQATASGNVIQLKVAPNQSESSRTAVISLQSASGSTQVAIYQMGDVPISDIEGRALGKNGEQLTFHVKSVSEIQIESSADWLTYQLEGEQLTVNIADFPPGSPTGTRSATLTVSAGKVYKMQYTYSQFNMEGEFDCFRSVDGVQQSYGTCRLEESATPLVYNVYPKGSIFDGPYKISYENGQFVIRFNQVLGAYDATRNIVLCAYDKAGRLSWDSKIEYVAPVVFSQETGLMTLTFQDNGTWAGQHVDGFYYSITDEQGTPTGTGWAVTDIVWVRK